MRQSQHFGNGGLSGKPDKKNAEFEAPIQSNRDQQASQQGGGAEPQNQK